MNYRSAAPLRIKQFCQSGVTLIELMIGMAIGLVIIGAVLTVFLGSRLTYQYNDAMGRIQENGRIAIDMMSEDLRMTGFIGCRRLWAYLPAGNTGSIAARQINFSNDFNAAVATSIGFSGTLNLGVQGFVFSVAVPNQHTGTDSVTVLKGSTEIPVTEFMDSETAAVTTASAVPVGPAIISDCRFDTLSLSDPSPTGIPAPAEGFYVTAASTSLAHATPFVRPYGTDAGVTPISPVSYSIRGAGRNDSSGNPVLSLFRNNDELIEGARNLCVRYGVATNATNETVGNFVTGGAVPDWKRVVAIRIELLLASVDDGTVDTVQPAMNFCGAPFVPLDRRMYKVFTTTVGLRNQIVSY